MPKKMPTPANAIVVAAIAVSQCRKRGQHQPTQYPLMPLMPKRNGWSQKQLPLSSSIPKKRMPPAKAIVIAVIDARKKQSVMKAIAIVAANTKKEANNSQRNGSCCCQCQPIPKKRLPPANAIAVAAVDARKKWPVMKAIAIVATNARKEVATSQRNSRCCC